MHTPSDGGFIVHTFTIKTCGAPSIAPGQYTCTRGVLYCAHCTLHLGVPFRAAAGGGGGAG